MRNYQPTSTSKAQEITEEFSALLSEDLPEQSYQSFIEQHTELVPREFVQNHGIHFELVLRKLSFGADYKSDLFYLSKSSDDWNCVFIELEKPTSKFFRDQSNEFHSDFVKALQQINTWKAWLLSADNKAAFETNTVGLIRTPLHWNPSFMKFVLVFGRRAEYENNRIRQRLIAAQEGADFKIITYDSLLEDLTHKHALYVGVRHNEFVEIVGDDVVGEQIFAWMEPEQIQVTRKLQDALVAIAPTSMHTSFRSGERFRKLRTRT